jgi:hypothetical protein
MVSHGKFSVQTCNGCYDVSKVDMKHILTLKDDLDIDSYVLGIPKKSLQSWQEWSAYEAKPWRCSAITKKGTRCLGAWPGYEQYTLELEEYLKYLKLRGCNPTGFCKIHQK